MLIGIVELNNIKNELKKMWVNADLGACYTTAFEQHWRTRLGAFKKNYCIKENLFFRRNVKKIEITYSLCSINNHFTVMLEV